MKQRKSPQLSDRVRPQLALVILIVGLFHSAQAQDTLWIWEYPSAANVSVTVRCDVNLLMGRYAYRYSLVSAPTSEQSVEGFFVDHNSTIDSVGSPNQWLGSPEEGSVVMWGAGTETDRIQPGGQLQGYSIGSPGIPSIFQFYVAGYVPIPSFDEITPDSVIGNDVFENSFKGRTVAPKDPPTPFNGLNILDTIKSHINQSRTLGWITTQQTADKYIRLIDSARSNLQANNRGVTKAKLDSVLLNANADSSSTLTSEAYALLRFNAEYVLQRLRQEDSAFAAENQSSSWNATAANNARHLTKSANYLHEVFVSGGELFYRRSTDEGSSWDQTHWINTAVGENSRPCIAATYQNSIQIVWQRKIAPSVYEVWHALSQDSGETWSTASILPEAGGVQVSEYQPDGTMPVIAGPKGELLVVVYCTSEGLRYRVSEDDGENWQIPEDDLISSQYGDRVRSPSLAGWDSHVSLLYDYVDDERSPMSRIYGSTGWSDENSVSGSTGTGFGEFPSVGLDIDKEPIAAWHGVSEISHHGKVIVFRSGYKNNTWSEWFTEFVGEDVDLLNPSVTYYNRAGEYGVAIVHHTAQDLVKLIRYTGPGEAFPWDISPIGESGAWANITHDNDSSGDPVYSWTGQGSLPCEVVVGPIPGMAPLRGRRPNKGAGVEEANPRISTAKRRAVVYHRELRATLALEFEPMKIVLANGDTSVVRFKASSLRQRGNVTFSNMWDYLGSDTISVPRNARRLVVSKQFAGRARSIGKRKFYLRVLNTNGIPIRVLDSTSTSGTVSLNIAPYAGMNVILRPQVILAGIDSVSLAIGVGDVFVVPDTPSKPKRERYNKQK